VAWPHLKLPSVLYFNTLALISSSGTLEIARRASLEMRDGGSRLWFYATLGLGLIFVSGNIRPGCNFDPKDFIWPQVPQFYFDVLTRCTLCMYSAARRLEQLVAKLTGPVPLLRRSTLYATSVLLALHGLLWLYCFSCCG